jgi:superoxide dismutase, Fe-Mn family
MQKLTLAQLPYAYNELEGVISQKIVELHHDKHQNAYVNGANAALEKLEKSRRGELEINVREVLRDWSFNYNGVLLHELFWQGMKKPSENNVIPENLVKAIEQNFDSVEAFKKEFSAAAVGVEGSGWAVLWKDKNHNLMIGQIEKHNLLAFNGWEPVLVLDVWEHAYYLDYVNNRTEFVEKWWSAVNWDDVAKRLS